MIVQYLIDWESFFPPDKDLDRIAAISISREMALLSACIRRNGAVIRSAYIDNALGKAEKLASEKGLVEIAGLIEDSRSLYMEFGILVDNENSKATSLMSTIDKWRAYLEGCGIYMQNRRDDVRFVLISNAPSKKSFYSICQLRNAYCSETLAYKWSTLLRYEDGNIPVPTQVGHYCLKDYLEAFSSATVENIRIYDPYISAIFDSVDGVRKNENAKAWRISLAFILDVVAKNKHIRRVDIITKRTRDQRERARDSNSPILRFGEVIDDILRRMAREIIVSFHFLRDEDDMHDRFMASDWYAFAIGHGFDVCKAEESYKSSSGLQLRNIPTTTDMRFSTFNVFYACSKNTAPDGIGLFGLRTVNDKGESDMYPANCSCRSYDEVADWFEYGKYARENPFRIGNVTISINERNAEDLF